MENIKILVADDDSAIVKLISDSLEDEGFTVIPATNGEEALRKLGEVSVSLLILDIMMPKVDGLEICRRIRQQISAPILLLSAKDRELDKVVGLEVGADDYLTKPFSINELVARVKAHLRRENRSRPTAPPQKNQLSFANMVVDKDNYEVYQDGNRVNLSTKEFQILLYLMENKNIVVSREKILDAVWGDHDYSDLNTVTVHIKNLRDKLDPENRFIKTVWGAGYKFTGGTE